MHRWNIQTANGTWSAVQADAIATDGDRVTFWAGSDIVAVFFGPVSVERAAPVEASDA